MVSTFVDQKSPVDIPLPRRPLDVQERKSISIPPLFLEPLECRSHNHIALSSDYIAKMMILRIIVPGIFLLKACLAQGDFLTQLPGCAVCSRLSSCKMRVVS